MRNSTAFVLLLLSVGLFFTVTSPYYEKVSALRAQSEQYKGILANVVELRQTRDDLLVKYENTPPQEIERLAKVLPDNVDTVNLAMNFDSIGAKYGISINKISTVDNANAYGDEIMQGSGGAPYEPVTVTFSFVATYDNFRNFMSDVEQSLRIIDVKSVSFESSETGLYEFNVAVQTYWLR